MSCSSTHAFGTDVDAIAMSPVVLPSGSASKRWIASSRRQNTSATDSLLPVVAVTVPVFLVTVVVVGFLGEHMRHHILNFCQHLLFAGLYVLFATRNAVSHGRKLVSDN